MSGGLLAWLFSRVDMVALRELAAGDRPEWLVAAGLAVVALPPLMAWRWQAILVAQGAGRLPLARLMRAVMAANLLNSFLPGKAGDLAKALYVREHGGLARGVGGVLLERGVDVGILGALGLVGYAFTGVVWGLWAGVILLGGALAGVAAMRFLPVERFLPGNKIPAVAEDLRATARVWCGRPALVAQTVAGSAAVWALCGVVLACLARALELPISWAHGCAVFPPAVMTGMLPVTVGGLGPRETVMTGLLAGEVGREAATALSLGYTVFTYWLLSLLSLPVAWGWARRAVGAGEGSASAGR